MKKRAITLAVAIGLGIAFVATTAGPGTAAISTESIGIVQPNGEWHLDYAEQDVTFWFGGRNDQPLLGDWDCDGVDSPAVFRRNGRIYLTNDNETGVASDTLFFGTRGDIAVAGDWDGDGCDTFGVYRPSQSKFYLSNSLITGPADAEFFFGGRRDRPLAGDWDGNGFDTVGVYRSSTGSAYLTNGIETGPADLTVVLGQPDDVVFAGDWDGDGFDALGFLRSSADEIHLLSANEEADETIIPANGLIGTPVSGILERVITVSPTGTALENGDELRRAAEFVATQERDIGMRWTIRMEPGTYDLSAEIPGLEVPDHTVLTGTAGAADTVLIYEVFGPSGAAITAGEAELEKFTIEADFGFASGTAVEANGLDVEVNGVAINIDTTRSATGILVSGNVIVFESTLDVSSSRTAVPIVVEEGGNAVVAVSSISAHGSFTGAIGIINRGVLTIDESVITVTPGAFGTACAGVRQISGELQILDTEIDVCTESLGGPNPPEPGTGVDVEAGEVLIGGGAINASNASINGNALVSATLVNLGAPVVGDVNCSNTVFGFALFPSECPGQDVLYRVNAGGDGVSGPDDTATWTADLLVPPSPFVNFDLVNPGHIDSHSIILFDKSIPPTTPVAIFGTERWDAEELPEMLWHFPVPYNIQTEVRLYFSSGFDGASLPGDRVFDVLIDGVLVLDDYDIVADVGHGVGTMQSFLVTTDIDGLDIEFRHTETSANNPQLNGVEVLVAPSGD